MTDLPPVVHLNVGGTLFQVSRSTLELYKDTMLYRLISQRWNQESRNPNEPLFIDRNGVRFQYVLDWMRDRQVNLPVTESQAAVFKELEYYGFQTVEASTIVPATAE